MYVICRSGARCLARTPRRRSGRAAIAMASFCYALFNRIRYNRCPTIPRLVKRPALVQVGANDDRRGLASRVLEYLKTRVSWRASLFGIGAALAVEDGEGSCNEVAQCRGAREVAVCLRPIFPEREAQLGMDIGKLHVDVCRDEVPNGLRCARRCNGSKVCWTTTTRGGSSPKGGASQAEGTRRMVERLTRDRARMRQTVALFASMRTPVP